jgi:hypothetical protein
MLDMAVSKGVSKAKNKALARWFPTIADLAADERNAAKLETLEILMDIEQVADLFASFEEARKGQVVNMNAAFGDL